MQAMDDMALLRDYAEIVVGSPGEFLDLLRKL